MTGHMVLSTLHTNDAVSTVNRLLDMGIKNYLLASALHGILAQRLVRRICPSCTQPAELQTSEEAWLKEYGNESAFNTAYKRGAGCAQCNYTGYQGRIGVYELLEFDQNLTESLVSGDGSAFTKQSKNAKGYKPLNLVALQYAIEGITTMEEVLRVSADVDAILEDDLIQTSEGTAI
jgi:MSHA biogenesis protein MshE